MWCEWFVVNRCCYCCFCYRIRICYEWVEKIKERFFYLTKTSAVLQSNIFKFILSVMHCYSTKVLDPKMTHPSIILFSRSFYVSRTLRKLCVLDPILMITRSNCLYCLPFSCAHITRSLWELFDFTWSKVVEKTFTMFCSGQNLLLHFVEKKTRIKHFGTLLQIFIR